MSSQDDVDRGATWAPARKIHGKQWRPANELDDDELAADREAAALVQGQLNVEGTVLFTVCLPLVVALASVAVPLLSSSLFNWWTARDKMRACLGKSSNGSPMQSCDLGAYVGDGWVYAMWAWFTLAFLILSYYGLRALWSLKQSHDLLDLQLAYSAEIHRRNAEQKKRALALEQEKRALALEQEEQPLALEQERARRRFMKRCHKH